MTASTADRPLRLAPAAVSVGAALLPGFLATLVNACVASMRLSRGRSDV